MTELNKIKRDIIARHKALIRMFREGHDGVYKSPIITGLACDCIKVVLASYGYEVELHNCWVHPIRNEMSGQFKSLRTQAE